MQKQLDFKFSGIMFYAREEVLQKTFEIKNDWLARQDRKRCFYLNLNAENGFSAISK